MLATQETFTFNDFTVLLFAIDDATLQKEVFDINRLHKDASHLSHICQGVLSGMVIPILWVKLIDYALHDNCHQNRDVFHQLIRAAERYALKKLIEESK